MESIVNKNKSKQHQSKLKLNDGSITTNKLEIFEKFNNFFIGVGPTLANETPKQSQSHESFMTAQLFNSLYLSNVSDEEVIHIINYPKPSSPGYDETSADILKLILPSICRPLVYILNLSLIQGIFPTELKVANVIPLCKTDDPMLFNNYRPVSILCMLSKVFEKVMYSRLSQFLDTYSKNNLVSENNILPIWLCSRW